MATLVDGGERGGVGWARLGVGGGEGLAANLPADSGKVAS
jgi:hypothetical protein